MNTFPDLKRLLRKADIKYEIFDDHTLTILFRSDSASAGWGSKFPVMVKVGTDNYCKFSSPAKLLIKYSDYRKQQFDVEAYCFNCEELITKMHRFGFLPENAMVRIRKVVDKEGWGYVRKAVGKSVSKSQKDKSAKCTSVKVVPVSKAA